MNPSEAWININKVLDRHNWPHREDLEKIAGPRYSQLPEHLAQRRAWISKAYKVRESPLTARHLHPVEALLAYLLAKHEKEQTLWWRKLEDSCKSVVEEEFLTVDYNEFMDD
tara:strand:- start:4281 stop:4616 length:336 start_codon:yes stop_codon:yes gene_type:complete